MDTKRVPDGKGLYYDLGHGVNKAEAMRQEIIFKIAHIRINFPDKDLFEELEDLQEYVDELSELAGAMVFTEDESQDVGFG